MLRKWSGPQAYTARHSSATVAGPTSRLWGTDRGALISSVRDRLGWTRSTPVPNEVGPPITYRSVLFHRLATAVPCRRVPTWMMMNMASHDNPSPSNVMALAKHRQVSHRLIRFQA